MNLRDYVDLGCIKPGELRQAMAHAEPERKLEALIARARLRYDSKLELARVDSASFAGFILRDEETGRPIKMAPFHREWHELLEDEQRCVIWSHFEAGKSHQLSIAYPLFKLGINPKLRVVIVSATGSSGGTASKIASAMQQHIEENAALHEVFPDLKPGRRWTAMAFDIERDTTIKDYSVQSVGVHGSIMGARIDLLIFDDILTYENTHTESRRQDVINWIKSTLLTRLTREAQVVFVGNAWHPDDAMHEFGKQWPWRKYPVRTQDGTISWPEKWSDSRIEEKELELGPHESARMLYCEARSDDSSRFKDAWFSRCKANGAGRKLRTDCTPSKPYEPGAGVRVFTGIDLGIGKKQVNARTAMVSLARHPDASRVVPNGPPGQYAIEILRIRSGKWDAEEILLNALEEQQCFGSQLIVEAVAAQRFMARFIQLFGGGRHTPVIAFSTDRRKAHPQYGVEGTAILLATGLVIIPSENDAEQSTHPEVTALIEDMRYYDPAAHTGDHLMAYWMASEGCAGRAARYAVSVTDEGTVEAQRTRERLRRIASIERSTEHPDPSIAGDVKKRRKLMQASQADGLWTDLDQLIDWGEEAGF